MEIAWYIYSILLLGVTGAACVAAVSVWTLTRRRDCLVAAVGFFAYALDTAIIFFGEYIRVKPVGDEFVVAMCGYRTWSQLAQVWAFSWCCASLRLLRDLRTAFVRCCIGGFAI